MDVEISPDPNLSAVDPPGWHVTWRELAGVLIVMVAIGVVIYVMSTSPDSPPVEHGKFWCNGSTGVYESRDGSAIVPEPFDPACNKIDEP